MVPGSDPGWVRTALACPSFGAVAGLVGAVVARVGRCIVVFSPSPFPSTRVLRLE